MGIYKGVSCDVFRHLKLPVCRRLGTLLCLSVQGGVVHPQTAVNQHTVGRNLVP